MKQSYIRIELYFGNNKYASAWQFINNGIYAGKGVFLTFSDTSVIGEKTFMDTEYLPFYQDEGSKRGIISYILSKHYGLLQYTTADSLVWTRINIEEPEEK